MMLEFISYGFVKHVVYLYKFTHFIMKFMSDLSLYFFVVVIIYCC